jgi:hypothetical protein
MVCSGLSVRSRTHLEIRAPLDRLTVGEPVGNLDSRLAEVLLPQHILQEAVGGFVS